VRPDDAIPEQPAPSPPPPLPPVDLPALVEDVADDSEESRLDFTYLVAHADRRWKAEENNATRLAARANLVLSGITAVIGLKLVAAGKELDVIAAAAPWVGVVFVTLIVLILIALGRALWLVLGVELGKWRKSGESVSASALLELDLEMIEDPENVPEHVLVVTTKAAEELLGRNAIRQTAVNRAQVAFLWGVGITVVSLFFYGGVAYEHSRRRIVDTREEEGLGRRHCDTPGAVVGAHRAGPCRLPIPLLEHGGREVGVPKTQGSSPEDGSAPPVPGQHGSHDGPRERADAAGGGEGPVACRGSRPEARDQVHDAERQEGCLGRAPYEGV